MGRTRERILGKARELFNDDGYARTTTRDIARACEISQGNLTYHFPAKNDLVVSLFHELKSESDRSFDLMGSGDFGAIEFREILYITFNLIYKYRFLFLEFSVIFREIPELVKEYQLLNKIRRAQFKELINVLVDTNLFAVTPDKKDRESLYELFNTYINFWSVDAQFNYRGDSRTAARYYAQVLLDALSLYMTDRGRSLFKGS